MPTAMCPVHVHPVRLNLSAYLISKLWYSVFLSQQISFSRLKPSAEQHGYILLDKRNRDNGHITTYIILFECVLRVAYPNLLGTKGYVVVVVVVVVCVSTRCDFACDTHGSPAAVLNGSFFSG
jgi:hypothetical protein